MGRVARTTISIEPELFAQFNAYIAASGYATRSEAVKSLMRSALVAQEWQTGRDVAGAILMVYDHHRGAIIKKLTDVQHDFGAVIVCTQHVHLDHHNCMEVVVVRGTAAKIRELLSKLKAVKGVKHSSLITATTGEDVR